MAEPLRTLILEFARAEQADDPFAFRPTSQTYLLRTAGGGYGQATFAWDDALLSDLAAVRDAGGDPQVLARLGERLRRFVEPLGWAGIAAQLVPAAQQGRRVLLTIRSAAAELYALPWELLTLDASGQHVGALPHVLLRYEWPDTATQPEKPLPRAGIGRILFAWSAAGGAVPASEQIDALSRACQDGFVPLDPGRDVLAHASLRRLGDALAAAKRDGLPISILHILCHGGETHGTFGLVLDGDAPSAAAITVHADRLRQMLAPHADMVRLVVLSACDSDHSGVLGNQLGSVAQALHRAGFSAVVASRYPLSVAGSIRFARCFYTVLFDRLGSLESALLDARADLAGDAAHRDWVSIQLYARAADGADARPLQFRPYPGLSAFDREQRRFYFGREDLTRRLWQRCQDLVGDAQATRLLAILAPSGFGKSSVARAGLLAEIDRQPLQFAQRPHGTLPAQITTMKPGPHPLATLQTVLRTDTADATAAELPQVLLVDQFEEVYTLCADAGERDAFVERLLTLARRPDWPMLIVITLRTDFIGETGQKHPVLNRLLGTQSVLVTAMAEADLRRCITEPAARLGRPLDDATVDLLWTQMQGHEGALPLLGFALSQIWEGLLCGRTPADTLRQIGGVGGALAGKAREIYGALSGAEQTTARRALVRLVRLGEGTRDTRRRMAVRALGGRGETEAAVLSVLRKFATEQARLVTLFSDGNQTYAEVTHEALLEHWTELRTWIGESRQDRALHDRGSDAAQHWSRSGRAMGLLWRTPDLEPLAEYQRRKPEEFDALLAEFLTASLRQQVRERRLRIGVAVSIFATLAVAVIIYKGTAEKIRQQLLDGHVERGRQLMFERGNPSEGLLWLHRAQAEGSTNPALPDLLASALHAAGMPRAVLIGHRDKVGSAAYSPDGRRIVTASDDNTARVWDAGSGRLLAELIGHGDIVKSAAYGPDGRHVVTASKDMTARVWDGESGRLLAELKGHGRIVNSAAYSPDGRHIVTAGDEQTARVWDEGSGTLIAELKGHGSSINRAEFSPDGRHIVTASDDKTARVWQASSGQLAKELKGHESTVVSATYRPDGHRIVTASRDNTARLWDADSGEQVALLNGHRQPVLSVAFSPDGRRIVTASDDGTAGVWDGDTGALHGLLQGHEKSVSSAAFSPDGRRIVTASEDGTVRLWDEESRTLLVELRGHAAPVVGVTFGPDGRQILSASSDKTARVWATDSDQLVAELSGHREEVVHAAYRPDGRHIVTASWDNTARVWASHSGRPVMELKGHRHSVLRAAYSPDGRHIVTASSENAARVWEADSGRQVAELSGYGASIVSATYSPDGRRIVTANAGDTAHEWDADSGQRVVEFKGHTSRLVSAAYSPDSRHIVTASWDRTARVWKSGSEHPIAVLAGHGDTIYSAAFGPDGQYVVTASADKTARVWEARSGRLVAELKGHAGVVNSATFSPDGRHVVTASSDKTARVWQAGNGRLVAELKGHGDSVHSAAFDPDGRRVVTASSDKTARVWEASNGRLLAELRGHRASLNSATYSPDGRQIVTTSNDKTARVWSVSPEARSPAQLGAFIRCHLLVQFEPSNDNIIIPHTPTLQDCPDAAYAR